MRNILLLIISFTLLNSANYKIKRDPFSVSKEYIQKTNQTYLEPKSNYIPFDIKVIGVMHSEGKKEAILDIEFEGVRHVREYETIKVKSPDIDSRLHILWIGERTVRLSVNGGEGVRYEMQ